ncbi:hypothetical protein D3Z39_03395 [Anaerotruncus colihominis]|uniref:Arylsulfotransferase N-terminal domain-containing protein n=1 Tax=Anaerotruncus colihominis TaxID=169435 RepID=A0A845REC7_9FIRM|nr:aryl-sulfate sulfotransferase [Anaerotruncus colihominis]NBI77929.1 hypothetical protein [Anaerotruncus colihominis]
MDLLKTVRLAALCIFLGLLLLTCGCMDLSNASGLGNPSPADETASNPDATLPTEMDPAAAIEQELALRRNEADSILSSQKAVDAQLLSELENPAHTLKNPYVHVDPYGLSPLSAILLFQTEEPAMISIRIPGKTEQADVSFAFDGLETKHSIPVYGLYAGQVNQVEITATSGAGKSETAVIPIETQPLPKALADNILMTEMVQPEKYQAGMNFTNPTGPGLKATAFDCNGDYRWYLSDESLIYCRFAFDDGRLMAAKGAQEQGVTIFYEMNYAGKIFNLYAGLYGCHHDIEVTDHNTFLITGTEGETVEDMIYEIDRTTGETVNKLDMKEVFQRTRFLNDTIGYGSRDWLHNNAVTWLAGEDKIMISARHQSLVAQISWPEGTIDWLLAEPRGWLPMFEPYLLTPVGDVFEWPSHQHAPKYLPDQDGNPDTVDILLFDNGNERMELYSRMVQYRIHTKERTVEQIWQYGKERGEELFAQFTGSANLMRNGNRLGNFSLFHQVNAQSAYNGLPEGTSALSTGNVFCEITVDGERVWEALATDKSSFGAYTSYRLERLPLYNDSDRIPWMGIDGVYHF